MKKFLRKYHNFRKTICAFLMLYMVHAFSVTALLASAPVSPLINIGADSKHTTQNKSNTANKNKSKPYSLFIAKHSQIKSIRLTENKSQLLSGSEISCLVPAPKTVNCNSNPFILTLCDNAYKRYRNLQVFLI